MTQMTVPAAVIHLLATAQEVRHYDGKHLITNVPGPFVVVALPTNRTITSGDGPVSIDFADTLREGETGYQVL